MGATWSREHAAAGVHEQVRCAALLDAPSPPPPGPSLRTLNRKGSLAGVKRRRLPSAVTSSSPSSCAALDSEPAARLEPCVPVATAPPTVWCTNQGNAGSVYPAGAARVT